MNKMSIVLLACVMTGLLVAACSGTASPASTSPPIQSATTAALTATAWQQRWSDVVAKAKQEGKVVVYTTWTPPVRDGISKALKDKYGIEVQFASFQRGPELVAKVQAEQRAGLYLVDLFASGAVTSISSMKPGGLLGSAKPYMILPEVLDAKAWVGGGVPYVDQDGTTIALVGVVNRNVIYNADQVKQGEISSIKDLLNPRYKGKIIVNDPSVAGTTSASLANLAFRAWGEADTTAFLKQLLRDQDPVLERDMRSLVDSVSRGKYAVGWGPYPDVAAEFLGLGAPIRVAPVAEDTLLIPAWGGISIPKKFSDENAAVVLINWLLSKEGGTVLSEASHNASLRVDVSTQGTSPPFSADPAVKYSPYSDEFILYQAQFQNTVIAKIVQEAMR